ncbi:glycosyltransferase [Sphingomonas histidinilytica]|uniref:Glycosyltransferase, catalytic subunit of cellulose synthase and poly-beta-1,6-N-acetylglucosamine synthase n=1 Tax=Rhizorhabdus histidinilytica TaxID=439228 RepID=A0A1T5FD60_9SPHN|nr:glycosyltransferase [Rhizorhabdus histidinilytica]MBO9375745.1 glycosyltransferase [Rhizorhabdus histidinilytica]SKB94090.1 Glycosyltransferase, catalytic subunit of cellulose synthase and poly-beta-1,6-N-acetylglucosamine synthase [Rhizorhabdus histidinilytica]
MTEVAAWLIVALPAVATLMLAIELAAGQWPVRPPPAPRGDPRIAVVIPAHDEEAAIAAAVAAARAAAPSGARLLVVADNCTDGTAGRARAAGAEAIARDDVARRGKGFALAFARDHLAADPPDVVVVVDADCAVAGDGIARLAAAAHAQGRPVQSAYLMRPAPERGALVALSGFAFLVRNLVRQRGLARLGAPALLTGSGMAFPWAAFAAAPLATDDLAEDLAIGIALARQGHPPVFVPQVATWSDPARRGATRAQRGRWEQGFLRTARATTLPLIATGRRPLVWLGLHLLVPPLALLLIVDGAVLALLALLASPAPFALLAALLGVTGALLLLCWWRFGRDQLSAGRLLLIPVYVLWKLPLYLAAALRPERRWIRTERD